MSKKNNVKKQIYGNPNWIKGRVNRGEYFISTFLNGLCYGIFLMASIYLYISNNQLPMIVTGGLAAWYFWRIIMVYVKRLHDLNLTGWLSIIMVVQQIGPRFVLKNEAFANIIDVIALLLSFLLLFWKGTKGMNKYGKDPLMKYEENE